MQLLPLSSKVFQFFFCFYQFLKPCHISRIPGTVLFFQTFFLNPEKCIGKSPLLFSLILQMDRCVKKRCYLSLLLTVCERIKKFTGLISPSLC